MYLILFLFMGLSWWVGYRLKSKFEKYSQTKLIANLSGAEIAQKMLNENGIYDVQVISVEGKLTDHYNPSNKTVNLSHDVFYGRNAAAAAVAAHECGHAVQHAQAYMFLSFRSSMVPLLSVTSKIMPFLLMGGIFILMFSGNPIVLALGVAFFALTTVFSVVTLPVEFDASARALKWMKDRNIVVGNEYDMSKDALKWAAMTYVVAALASIAQLLYYVMILMGRRD